MTESYETEKCCILCLILVLSGLVLFELKILEMESITNMKIFMFIIAIVCTVFLYIFIGYSLFYVETEMKTVEWVTMSNVNNDFRKSESRIFVFDETVNCIKDFQTPRHLQLMEFYAENLQITDLSFSRCKELEEIIFHEAPEVIHPKAFEGCINLRTIYLPKTGTNSITLELPKSCAVEFRKTKGVDFPTDNSIYIKTDLIVKKN